MGSDLEKNLVEAWDNALAAAKRYGSFVDAMNKIDSDINSSQDSGGGNLVVGDTGDYDGPSDLDMIKALASSAKQEGAKWSPDNSQQQNAALHAKVASYVARMQPYGVEADYNPGTGEWIITRDKHNPGNIGKYLFDVYHSGGVAGDMGTLKENELLAKLEQGEVIVSNQNKRTLFDLIDFVSLLRKEIDTSAFFQSSRPPMPSAGDHVRSDNVVSNQNNTVNLGDVYIYGANNDTVEKHREVNRELANEIFKQLNIKR